ncbi:MAG: hypothetical protein FIB03_03130 [Anaerolineae bacterium]|nr:hypothetical protein [Anaerolineae bacterium]
MKPHDPSEVSDHQKTFSAQARERSRQWERKHRSHKAVYRGVDPKLSLRVKSIAADVWMPVGKVAGALIGYSLQAYEQDDLDLHPHIRPNLARRTLYPKPERFQNSGSKRRSNLPQPIPWRVVTTWRNFSPELKRAISALASGDGLNVPAGELVSALLRYGLNAHDAGLLKLEPDEETVTSSSPKGHDT